MLIWIESVAVWGVSDVWCSSENYGWHRRSRSTGELAEIAIAVTVQTKTRCTTSAFTCAWSVLNPSQSWRPEALDQLNLFTVQSDLLTKATHERRIFCLQPSATRMVLQGAMMCWCFAWHTQSAELPTEDGWFYCSAIQSGICCRDGMQSSGCSASRSC